MQQKCFLWKNTQHKEKKNPKNNNKKSFSNPEGNRTDHWWFFKPAFQESCSLKQIISHSREYKAIDNKSNRLSHKDCACQCLPLCSPRAGLPGSEAAGLCQPKQLPRRWPLLNHTLFLPSATQPIPAPHQKPWSAQSTAGTCEQPLTQPGSAAVQPQRAQKGQQERNCAGGLWIGTNPLEHQDKSTMPKDVLTAVDLPNGRDSSRKTNFPTAIQLLCYFSYPEELINGFLSDR